MTKEKTILIKKDFLERTIPSNYSPITCLRTISKIIRAQVKKIYFSLEYHRLLPQKKKGCLKRTNDLQCIDLHILKEVKTKRENVTLACINNKKAYDIVLQTWSIKYQKIYKLSNKVINFTNAMKNCKVEIAGKQTVVDVKIQRVISHGDSLTPLFILFTQPLR